LRNEKQALSTNSSPNFWVFLVSTCSDQMRHGTPLGSTLQIESSSESSSLVGSAGEYELTALQQQSVAPPAPAAGKEGEAQAVGRPANAGRGGGRKMFKVNKWEI